MFNLLGINLKCGFEPIRSTFLELEDSGYLFWRTIQKRVNHKSQSHARPTATVIDLPLTLSLSPGWLSHRVISDKVQSLFVLLCCSRPDSFVSTLSGICFNAVSLTSSFAWPLELCASIYLVLCGCFVSYHLFDSNGTLIPMVAQIDSGTCDPLHLSDF